MFIFSLFLSACRYYRLSNTSLNVQKIISSSSFTNSVLVQIGTVLFILFVSFRWRLSSFVRVMASLLLEVPASLITDCIKNKLLSYKMLCMKKNISTFVFK